MRIDKEGNKIILNSFIIFAAIIVIIYLLGCPITALIVGIILLFKWLFTIRFFRLPHREQLSSNDGVFSPADGTIVALEKTYEGEYFQDERIQVSIFMSIWNVHANWFPIKGKVDYFRHHHGKFLVAYHPKSSTENERTTTVVDRGDCKILFRQIAGYIARRIVSYAVEGTNIEQNSRCGFIKFGSRIDLFLPLDADIKIALGDKVTGSQTIIATIKKK